MIQYKWLACASMCFAGAELVSDWHLSESLHRAVKALDLSSTELERIGPAMLASWNASRPAPLVTPESIRILFDAKKKSIFSLDVRYRTTLTRRGRDALPSVNAQSSSSEVWWTRWAMDGSRIGRMVASSRQGLAHPSDDQLAQSTVFDGLRTWVREGDQPLSVVSQDEGDLFGIEGTWLGAGGCLGDRDQFTARAGEHDLAGMIERSHPDAIVVESGTIDVAGVVTVVLRMGWDDPIWLYLDPARSLAPVRIDRRLSVDGGTILIRTDVDMLERVESGVWLPRRIRLSQFELPDDQFQAGDEPTGPWYLRIESTLESLACNRPLDWKTWGRLRD